MPSWQRYPKVYFADPPDDAIGPIELHGGPLDGGTIWIEHAVGVALIRSQGTVLAYTVRSDGQSAGFGGYASDLPDAMVRKLEVQP